MDISESVGLSIQVGLWQGLAVGDFDNDGRPDIAAGNIGRNSPLEPYRESLVFLSRGTDPRLTLFAMAEEEKLLPIDDMDLYSRVVDRAALPETYRDFSDVDLLEVLKPFAPMKRTEINCLETSIFFNRGGRYERVALPTAAQLSPVSAINVADFDNDGLDDLFLSQNWYSIRPDLGRLDSGAGLVLLGQGEDVHCIGFQPEWIDDPRGESQCSRGGFRSRRTSRYCRAANAWPSALLPWPSGEARHPCVVCRRIALGRALGRNGALDLLGRHRLATQVAQLRGWLVGSGRCRPCPWLCHLAKRD